MQISDIVKLLQRHSFTGSARQDIEQCLREQLSLSSAQGAITPLLQKFLYIKDHTINKNIRLRAANILDNVLGQPVVGIDTKVYAISLLINRQIGLNLSKMSSTAPIVLALKKHLEKHEVDTSGLEFSVYPVVTNADSPSFENISDTFQMCKKAQFKPIDENFESDMKTHCNYILSSDPQTHLMEYVIYFCIKGSNLDKFEDCIKKNVLMEDCTLNFIDNYYNSHYLKSTLFKIGRPYSISTETIHTVDVWHLVGELDRIVSKKGFNLKDISVGIGVYINEEECYDVKLSIWFKDELIDASIVKFIQNPKQFILKLEDVLSGWKVGDVSINTIARSFEDTPKQNEYFSKKGWIIV